MKFGFGQVIWFVVGALAYFATLYYIDKSLGEKKRVYFRYAAVTLTLGAFFYALQTCLPIQRERAEKVSQAAIALIAAACVFYEQARAAAMRPIAERWKKLV